jgi:hypothetical protein
MIDNSGQCEFYFINDSGRYIRCTEPISQEYKFEDGTQLSVCDKHLMAIWDAMSPEIFPPDIN